MNQPPPPYWEALGGEAEHGENRGIAPGATPDATVAAGPWIKLLPGGTLQEQAQLSALAKDSLKAVLVEVKRQLLPQNPEVTDAELTHFIEKIFDEGWRPGHRIEPPDIRRTVRSKANSTAVVGTLVESLSASAASQGRPRPRAFADRKAHRDNAPRSDKWWRQAGAPVRMLCDHRQDGSISFSLRDVKFGIMAMDSRVNWEGTKADAYFEAMRKNDEYFVKQAHEYNIDQAIYICRNRLTHWSNPGVGVGQVPLRERLGYALSDITLCRNSAFIARAPQAALDRILTLPAPKLFR